MTASVEKRENELTKSFKEATALAQRRIATEISQLYTAHGAIAPRRKSRPDKGNVRLNQATPAVVSKNPRAKLLARRQPERVQALNDRRGLWPLAIK